MNIYHCEITACDVSKIMAETYALKCRKLQILAAGGNNFDENTKNTILSYGILNAPNSIINLSDNLEENFFTIKLIPESFKERSCKILKFIKKYEELKDRKFRYFPGKDSLLKAIGFDYLSFFHNENKKERKNKIDKLQRRYFFYY